jgi:GntR family galactonate operon transcriptional repressor
VTLTSPFDDFVRRYGATPRRGLYGQLVHDIGRRIVGGEFPVCATLPNEDELIARFRVSRTTFREVMKTLASKGLVEIRPKTGTRVREHYQWHHIDPDVMVWYYETGPSRAVLDALRDVRRILEPAAAARAAERAGNADIARMEAAYEAMCQGVTDPPAYGEADREFHTAIFSATGNFILSRLIDVIAIGIHGNAVAATSAIIPKLRASLPFHADLLAAIRARDPAAAEAAARRLLDDWHPEAGRVGRALGNIETKVRLQ